MTDSTWDLPTLDFFHLPFESDFPQDILECSFRDHERDTVDDYSTSILTPPLSGCSSEDEHFSFPQTDADQGIEHIGTSNILLGHGAGHPLSTTNWATPPTSPLSEKGHAAPPSRFNFSFKQRYPSVADLSSEEEYDVWSAPPKPWSSSVRRRRSTSGANKSRKATKSAVATALTTITPDPVSPESPSYPNSADEMDEPESKRKSHNVLERKRRNDLKKSYQELRMQLPNLVDNVRAPTGHILTKAVEYIQELKAEEATHLRAIEDIRKRNTRSRLILESARS